METRGKVIERKKDLQSIGDSQEINQAASRASSIVEIDLAYNQLE